MLLADGAAGVLLFGLWVFCVADILATDGARCRNLPKVWWLLAVVLMLDVGAALWLVAGRPWQGRPPGARARLRRSVPEPGKLAQVNPEDDETFRRRVRERAEEQRRHYRDDHPGGGAAP